MNHALYFSVQPGWKILISDIGLNPADVLTLAGLPTDLFSRRHATLSAKEYFDLWKGLEQAAGKTELPLKIGQAISTEAFDPPIFASLCSPNLNAALQRLSQFKKLIGPLTLEVEMKKEHTKATIDCYGHNGHIPRSLGVSELVFLTKLARLGTREPVAPTKVILAELPEHRYLYTEYFGTSIQAGKKNQIAFSAKDGARPFLTENAAMWDFFEPTLKQKLSDLEMEASTADRVKSALLEMLPSGLSSLEEVANRLAISKRSMQRRLNAEGSSYQTVLNSIREELAQHYLSKSSFSQGEISFLLGFQDTNSFTRAFSSWTGKTPGQYREALQ